MRQEEEEEEDFDDLRHEPLRNDDRDEEVLRERACLLGDDEGDGE